MSWSFHFCAPALPNDPTLQFHRDFQISTLLSLLIVYGLIYFYYSQFGPDPLAQNFEQNDPKKSIKSIENNNKTQKTPKPNEKDSDSSIENQQKSAENESHIGFKSKKISLKSLAKKSQKSKKILYQVIENVTVTEIQGYFPIVFGHFAIAVGLSSMYTPYMEQSIAVLVYAILSIVLAILNGKRSKYLLRGTWAVMACIVLYVLISGMVEIAQTNFANRDSQCFLRLYQNIY